MTRAAASSTEHAALVVCVYLYLKRVFELAGDTPTSVLDNLHTSDARQFDRAPLKLLLLMETMCHKKLFSSCTSETCDLLLCTQFCIWSAAYLMSNQEGSFSFFLIRRNPNQTVISSSSIFDLVITAFSITVQMCGCVPGLLVKQAEHELETPCEISKFLFRENQKLNFSIRG